MILFDLDEVETINQTLRLLKVDRPAIFSLTARRHLERTAEPLKVQVMRRLAQSGVIADGPVRLLCMPAVFGQVFNPISVYFCHRANGDLAAVLYEVNNTFGGSHTYLGVASAPDDTGRVRHSCRKALHVSPFMDGDLIYDFAVAAPGARAEMGIEVRDEGGVIMTAAFAGVGEPLTDRGLIAVLLRHPLLMIEVLGAIHWEALKLFTKGLRLRPDSFKAPAR